MPSLQIYQGGNIWIETPSDTVAMVVQHGIMKKGLIHSIREAPVRCSGQNPPHHATEPWSGERRVVLIAFCPASVMHLGHSLRNLLDSLGFNPPCPNEASWYSPCTYYGDWALIQGTLCQTRPAETPEQEPQPIEEVEIMLDRTN